MNAQRLTVGAPGLTAAPLPVRSCAVAGRPGKSAYECAVALGFPGTEAEWLASLVGPQGPQGAPGVSPTVTTRQVSGGAEIDITDGSGVHTAALADGVSPTVRTETTDSGYLLWITDRNGTVAVPLYHGPQGPQGETGPQGPQGPRGEGLSVQIQEIPEGYGVDISDRNGTESLILRHGPQGETGPQGPQGETGPQGPQGETGPRGPQGETGPRGAQGEQGPAGSDGFSPTVEAIEREDGVELQIEDANGSRRVTVPAGPQGPQGEQGPRGEQGPAGIGLPSGGTAGQLLVKASDTDYACAWVTVPSANGGSF